MDLAADLAYALNVPVRTGPPAEQDGRAPQITLDADLPPGA